MKKSNLFKKSIYTSLAAVTLMGVGVTTIPALMSAQSVSATTYKRTDQNYVKGSDGWYYRPDDTDRVGKYSKVTIKTSGYTKGSDSSYTTYQLASDPLVVGFEINDDAVVDSITKGYSIGANNDQVLGTISSPETNITIKLSAPDSSSSDTPSEDGSWVYNDETGETTWVPATENHNSVGSASFDVNDIDANGNVAQYSSERPGLKSYDGETWIKGTNQGLMNRLKNESDPDDQIVRGDTTNVQDAIDEANSIDSSLYTKASYGNLTNAVNIASPLLYDDFATQAKMDAGAELFNNAIKHLVKKNKPQGPAISANKYVTLTSKNYKIWTSFDFNKVKHYSKNYYQKTYHVKTIYNHENGSTYLSLYDSKDHWFGYINATGTKTAKGAQGTPISAKQYVTLTSKNYKICSGFDFKTVKHYSKNYYQKTYLVKTIYNHASGSTYYSLYDSKGKWFGYINASGVKKGSGQQGAAISYNKNVKIKKSGYTIWGGFFNKKRGTSTKYKNKTLKAKIKYNAINGSTYLSLYSGRKWVGYVNANVAK